MSGWFLLQLASTWFMVGLIWFVQVVHYPMFSDAHTETEPDRFVSYERVHQQRTTWVVMPIMLLELTTAILCFTTAATAPERWLYGTGLLLLILVWASTMFVQVPLHNQLSAGFASVPHGRLVLTNWIRTVLWTARGLLLLYPLRSLKFPAS